MPMIHTTICFCEWNFLAFLIFITSESNILCLNIDILFKQCQFAIFLGILVVMILNTISFQELGETHCTKLMRFQVCFWDVGSSRIGQRYQFHSSFIIYNINDNQLIHQSPTRLFCFLCFMERHGSYRPIKPFLSTYRHSFSILFFLAYHVSEPTIALNYLISRLNFHN